MLILRSTCLCVLCHVYAQIYMFMLRSTSLCLDLCVYVLRAMLVCLDLCWLLCHVLLKLFHPLISLFLAFWPFWQGVDLGPMVQAYIHTPRPILKSLDNFLCMSMFACFLLCFISMLASLNLGFATLCALYGLVLVDPQSHQLSVVASILPKASLGVTTCETHLRGVGVLDTHFFFSALCDVDMLVLLALCHPFGFLCFFVSFACLLTYSCMSLCVVHIPFQWNYGHSIQTYICPPMTPPFV